MNSVDRRYADVRMSSLVLTMSSESRGTCHAAIFGYNRENINCQFSLAEFHKQDPVWRNPAVPDLDVKLGDPRF